MIVVQSGRLKQHLRIHTGKKNKCNNYRTVVYNSLLEYILKRSLINMVQNRVVVYNSIDLRIHTGEKPHKCDSCCFHKLITYSNISLEDEVAKLFSNPMYILMFTIICHYKTKPV